MGEGGGRRQAKSMGEGRPDGDTRTRTRRRRHLERGAEGGGGEALQRGGTLGGTPAGLSWKEFCRVTARLRRARPPRTAPPPPTPVSVTGRARGFGLIYMQPTCVPAKPARHVTVRRTDSHGSACRCVCVCVRCERRQTGGGRDKGRETFSAFSARTNTVPGTAVQYVSAAVE